MLQLPREPRAGQPVSAQWGAEIVRYLRAITPRPSGFIWPEIGAGGTKYFNAKRGGAPPIESPNPWDLTIDGNAVDGYTAKVRPGNINGLLPTNMFDDFAIDATSTWHVKLAVTANEHEVTEASIVIDNTPATGSGAAEGAPPSYFETEIGVIFRGLTFNIALKNIVASVVSAGFTIDDAAGPDDPLYVRWFAWGLNYF